MATRCKETMAQHRKVMGEEMISCAECREKLSPEDPRIPTGRYHHSTCDYYCNKTTYDRELEQASKVNEVSPQPVNITYQIDARSTPAFKELSDRIRFLEGKKNDKQDYAPF